MQPSLRTVSVNGLDLAVWEWPGEGSPLVFVHATGFHGRCWDEVIRLLPGRRALAVELRGHGRSAKPAPPYPWRSFGEDVAALSGVLDLQGAIGIGHSMGGHSLVVAAALAHSAFASLLLLDPVIYAPEYYGGPLGGDPSFIARRRNAWASPGEMYDRFRDRPPFVHWRPEVLRDYCDYGLLPSGDRYVLACPPEIEASIYTASNEPSANIHPLLSQVTQPVTILRGGIPWNVERFDLAASPTTPDLAKRFPNAKDVLLEGRSHYIPMESPDLVATTLLGLHRR
jgi:pimeloyl-ACP methyl ester carboxylesterase